MLVRNRKSFNKGLLLMGSFLLVLVLIFLPMEIWGTRGDHTMNFLEYADNLFNRLSKGSSYFIPEVQRQVKPLVGTPFHAEIKPGKPDTAEAIVTVLRANGAEAQVTPDGMVVARGNLGALLTSAVRDSEALFENNAQRVEAKYPGLQGRDVLKAWWSFLDPLVKELQQQTLFNPAKIVNTVEKKAVEPGFNFYGIQAEDVGDRALLVIMLLTFYVIYTLWYGFAIFELFEGMGLSMKKAKIKKEV
ncbi:hypothetical protein V6C53_16200 [Desulfocurvibacter africanus]|uniref:hypothetical protein n=1 Tax=Desulfocurvibacter africanus TaxID=873 RepID=UPI002FDA0BA4